MQQFNGLTALVTGASSGLGAEFAKQLARVGANLILVARREPALVSLKEDIESSHSVEISIVTQDLNEPGAVTQLMHRVDELGLRVDVLVNNAGFGVYGHFVDVPFTKTQQMLNLDMVVLTELTHAVATRMKQRKAGYILNVASIGGFQATPTYAAYSAAKAYVLLFSEALHVELKPYHIHVSTLSPGITATEFLDVSGQQTTLYQRLVMMTAPKVVQIGLKALGNNKASVVPGLINKLTVWSNRLTPRAVQSRVAHQLMKND